MMPTTQTTTKVLFPVVPVIVKSTRFITPNVGCPKDVFNCCSDSRMHDMIHRTCTRRRIMWSRRVGTCLPKTVWTEIFFSME